MDEALRNKMGTYADASKQDARWLDLKFPRLPFNPSKPATFTYVNLVRTLIIEANPLKPGDGMDFCHAVMASTFGSFATLDKHWKRRVDSPPRISVVGQVLPGIMCLLSANSRTPHSFVDTILLDLLGKCEAARGEERAFFGAAQSKVSNRRENLQFWRERAKRHVETDLIVPRAGRPMRECDCVDLARVIHHPMRLANSLGTNREWIEPAAQNVTRQKEA